MTKQHGPRTDLAQETSAEKKRRSKGEHQVAAAVITAFVLIATSSSGVMSQRQICPSWQPVMMVLKSSITSTVLMQWVGAVRPHRTMGRTRLFPDMMLLCLECLDRDKDRDRGTHSLISPAPTPLFFFISLIYVN